jgi:hypothetical protein
MTTQPTNLATSYAPPGSPLNTGGAPPGPGTRSFGPSSRANFRAGMAQALSALRQYVKSQPNDRLTRSQLQKTLLNNALPLAVRQGALCALMVGTPRPDQTSSANQPSKQALADDVLTLAECDAMLQRLRSDSGRSSAGSARPVECATPGPQSAGTGLHRLSRMLRQLAGIASSKGHGKPVAMTELLAALSKDSGHNGGPRRGDSFVLAAIGLGPRSSATPAQLMQLSELLDASAGATSSAIGGPHRAKNARMPANADMPRVALGAAAA